MSGAPVQVHVRITRYEVSCLPPDNSNASLYTVAVEWRGEDQWAVTRHRSCFDADGVGEYEPAPSSRSEGFLRRTRFSLDEALVIARRVAPTLVVNGYTVQDALGMR